MESCEVTNFGKSYGFFVNIVSNVAEPPNVGIRCNEELLLLSSPLTRGGTKDSTMNVRYKLANSSQQSAVSSQQIRHIGHRRHRAGTK
jgi:hypothetical protein